MRIDLEQKVSEREVFGIIDSLIRRLESNPIELVDIELYLDKNEDEEDRVRFT